MSFIYEHAPVGDEHERSIADGLGLSVEEVRVEFITPAVAQKLAAGHAGLGEAELVGATLTSLCKALCGASALKTAAGQ